MQQQLTCTRERNHEEKNGGKRTFPMEEEVWSWGAGTDGQLGTGRLEDELIPRLLTSLSSAGSISFLACGGAHVVALTSYGKALAWGRGTSGQLGHGDTASTRFPKLVESLDDHSVVYAAAGWNHSGFVSDEGAVFTCGDGSFGQLGHGAYDSSCTPVGVTHLNSKRVKQVACGMRHSLVLLEDSAGNQVYAFGYGKRGQLGISKDRVKSVNAPFVTIGLDANIIRVLANGDHSAAISDDGDLYTWGRAFCGSSDSQYPQRVTSPVSVSEAALGWNHALVLSCDAEVFMIGGTKHGLLSRSEISHPDKLLPDSGRDATVQAVGLGGSKVTRIAAGAEHSALVTENGEVHTWGWGEHGQLGLGDTSDHTNPQAVNLGLKDQIDTNVYCGSGFTYVVRRHGHANSCLFTA